MFDPNPINVPVHRAAYWGNKSDYLQEKPENGVDQRMFDPTIVLQYMMLSKSEYRLFIIRLHNFLIKQIKHNFKGHKITFRMIEPIFDIEN